MSKPRARLVSTSRSPRGRATGRPWNATGPCLTEAEERWPGGRVLLIGSHAAFVALEHLCAGVPLHDALTNPRPWQPGWSYEFASSLETA